MRHVFVRDLDLGVVDHLDARRLEIVADGFPLFGGAKLAIDTTLVSPVRQYGTSRRGAGSRDGTALAEARRKKARTYPRLDGQGGRARLVVLADEIGGRWSSETSSKARVAPAGMQGSSQAAWRRRWASMLSCAAARACALSLLELRVSPGADGDVPSVHEVVGDCRYC